MFRAGSQVSWYEWILPISSWDFTIRTFICPFCYDIFCHNSMTACHMMSKMIIWAIGPMAYVPTKFHWDSFKRRLKSDQPLLLQTKLTTTSPIIITRGTVPRGTVDPIPNGLSLRPRTMFRQVTPSPALNALPAEHEDIHSSISSMSWSVWWKHIHQRIVVFRAYTP